MIDRINNAPAGFVEFDGEGAIIYINTTLASLLGYSAEELHGKKFESVLTIANRIFFQTHFLPLLQLNGTASEVFLILRACDGTSLPMIASASKRGDITQCVFLTFSERRKYEREILLARHSAEDALQNNAELKAARDDADVKVRTLDRRLQELAALNQELVHLARILSHDLREPVRKVRIFADILSESISKYLDADGVAALEKINSESDRAIGMITSVRRFMDSGNTRELHSRVDLNAIVEATARRIRESFSDWDLIADRLPSIEGRHRQLQVLIEEILDNAVKFRRRDRKLKITIIGRAIQQNAFNLTKEKYAYRDFLQIEIADNGNGIAPEYQKYVFEPLKKIAVQSSGLGMGLAMSRKIVESHYGSIEVATHTTDGTTIVIRLPVDSGVEI